MRRDINGKYYVYGGDINPTLEQRALHSHAKITPGTYIIFGVFVLGLILSFASM